jgi:hypothetical protein
LPIAGYGCEFKEKYLIQSISLEQLFNRFKLMPKSRYSGTHFKSYAQIKFLSWMRYNSQVSLFEPNNNFSDHFLISLKSIHQNLIPYLCVISRHHWSQLLINYSSRYQNLIIFYFNRMFMNRSYGRFEA